MSTEDGSNKNNIDGNGTDNKLKYITMGRRKNQGGGP